MSDATETIRVDGEFPAGVDAIELERADGSTERFERGDGDD